MDADGGAAALAADVGGGLFRAVGAIAMSLVDDDGFSDGDGDVAPVGARLGLEEIDDGAADGNVDGKGEGSDVGELESVGLDDGSKDGYGDGAIEGKEDGSDVGKKEGSSDGKRLGERLGELEDGCADGYNEGASEGTGGVRSFDGKLEDAGDCARAGALAGAGDGAAEGTVEGSGDGLRVGGTVDGATLGAAVGAGDGDGLGDCVHAGVLHPACSVVNGHGVPVPSEIVVMVRCRLERPPPPATVGWGKPQVRISDRRAYILRCSCPTQSMLMPRGS